MEYFKCKLTDNWILYKANDNIADMVQFSIDYKNMKAFFSLINESVHKLKSKGLTKIQHIVTISDYNDFLKNKTTWNIINEDKLSQTYMLECDIDSFKQNFAIGHGL